MEFEIRRLAPGHYAVDGDLDEAAAISWVQFCERIATGDEDGKVHFDLAELDIASGPACAMAVGAIRSIVDRSLHPVLTRAPQELAHVLYRVGMLPSLTLLDPREELPTSS